MGDDDEGGALNHLTEAEVVRGISEVQDGKLFTLQRMIGDPRGDPAWPRRTPAEREQIFDESAWDDGGDGPAFPGGLHYADDKISAFLPGSTQYDALGHVWYDGKLGTDTMLAPPSEASKKGSVAPIAEREVAGRGILLDLARYRGKAYLDTAETFSHEDLEACAAAQGITIGKRDILLIRTNHLQLFHECGPAFHDGFCESGLVYSPALVEWFQDREIPNLVTDTIANEVTVDPNNGVALVLHNALMRNLGIAFTEICDLEKLAADCADDGKYTFFYAAAPLKIHRASGSPVNPIVIK